MRKIMVYAEFPSPYRVAVFEVLAQYYNLEVYYECKLTEERDCRYAVQTSSFPFYFLDEQKGCRRFHKKILHLKNFDGILVYNACLKNGAFLAICSKLQGIPYFVNNDGGFINKNILKNILKRFVFGGAAICFASGSISTKYFQAYGVKNSRIKVHNFTSLNETDILKKPVDDVKKRELRRKLQISEDKVCFITVGQFIPRKGIDLLLQAWKKINDDNCCLLIIGGGSQRYNYEKYIGEHKLKNIRILDFLPKEELFNYYQAVDVFVFPTREDIWGLVINEAMACGLPIISSNMCLAAKELIEDGINGFLYDVQNTSVLSDLIEKIAYDPNLRKKMALSNIAKIQGNTMAAIGEKHHVDIENYFVGR